ncbi:MAG: hypothetical protein K8I30_07495, partial [Anaerolineae bacterium]|nr:hypothetical protein [Anaerolineae bacterium]
YKYHTQIIDSHGQIVGRVTEEGDGFTIAEVELPESPRQPDQPQPRMRTSDLAFWINDKIIPFAVRSQYRKKAKKQS